jgi:hypothetical protein
MDRITFEVQDYPPPKENLSAMSIRNPVVPRARLLLETAHRALAEQAFGPVAERPVRFDITLFGSTDEDPYDPTSYISGILEVLKEKSDLSDINCIGTLGRTWLYRNGQQIRYVTYRHVEGNQTGYSVTISTLG